MSTNGKRPYAQMLVLANELVEWLSPACQRIEIAGSLRRKRSLAGDVELVAVPILLQANLFGEVDLEAATAVDMMLSGCVKFVKNGPRLKQFEWQGHGGLCTVDLFLQPDPATFGVNYLLRTGSAAYSKWMVTERRYGGAMPNDYRVRDARVWQYGKLMDTPEETDVFRLWHMAYIAPEERER